MIVSKEIGNGLVRTFSDVGNYITRDSVLFADAVDPKSAKREYVETDEKIDAEQVSEEDKDAALRRFGVEV